MLVVPGHSGGRSVLRNYRLYRLDGAGKISGAEWIEADSDETALEQARGRVDGIAFELWDKSRLVERSRPSS